MRHGGRLARPGCMCTNQLRQALLAAARSRGPHLGVGGLGGELVTPLAVLVVQQHHPVCGAHGEAAAVGRPGHAGHPRSAVLRDTHSLRRRRTPTPRPPPAQPGPARPAGLAASVRAAAASRRERGRERDRSGTGTGRDGTGPRRRRAPPNSPPLPRQPQGLRRC